MRTNNICYIASAGAGKTTKVVSDAINKANNNSLKKIAIITYTQNNQAHIRTKLENQNMAHKIIVMGWFEFLLKHWIMPFKTTVFPQLINTHLGISPVEGKSGLMRTSNGKTFVTYKKDDFRKKYITPDGNKVYSDKLSELANEVYLRNKLEIIDRLNSIFGYLYFDECQDFVGFDYEIIKLLLTKTDITCVFAGDPRQHTYSTHATSKYTKYTGDIASFIQENINKRKVYVTIDITTLVESYRCPMCICDFASLVMPQYPKMKSHKTEDSIEEHCMLVRSCDVERYVNQFNPVALIWDSKAMKNVHTSIKQIYNMGAVKGLDFPHIIVYPTSGMLKWIKNISGELADTTRAKLYVAVTRAEISTGIVVPDDYYLPLDSILKFWESKKD